jgi:deoxyribonuclease V
MAWQKRYAEAYSAAGWPGEGSIRYVGGADLAFAPTDLRSADGKKLRRGAVGSPAVAAAVVWDLLEQRAVEQVRVRAPVTFPYVPGVLSFREAPLLKAAIRRVKSRVDVWIFDGHGRAHPRGMGLATHMGMLLDSPSVGAAKSVLLGKVDLTARRQRDDGCWEAPVMWQERCIALALWRPGAQRGTTPMVYASAGQHCTLAQAADLVARCLRPGMPMPEPTRLADLLSKE